MSSHESSAVSIRSLRFHSYGEPADVLRLERIAAPSPGTERIRVVVHACGLNPADWALCRGLFAGQLPRGVGLDVAGVVDAVGEGVTDVVVGDRVLGTADFRGETSAGASDRAILDHWARVPAGLDMAQAAALPMAVETAYRHIDALGVSAGQTIVIHGAGTMVGFAAVQIASMRGAHVIATAGETYAGRLRALGAKVTSYGEGLRERLSATAGGPIDWALDAAPGSGTPDPLLSVGSGALSDLVSAVGGDPRRVLTMSDFATAAKLGVRTTFGENPALRYDVLGEFAQRAAEGRFSIPIARTFALEEWRAALDISLSKQARGKLVLLPLGNPGLSAQSSRSSERE